jgi:hypothetical protein
LTGRRTHSTRRGVVRLRVCGAARRGSVLGPLRRAMASRRRVHLSRSAERTTAASRAA